MKRTTPPLALSLALCAASLAACSGDINTGTADPSGASGQSPREGLSPAVDQPAKLPGDPNVNYSLALRSAAIRLVGALPTGTEIKQMQGAADPARAYEAAIDAYLKDPRFAVEQTDFWRNTMRLGGRIGGNNLDSAPSFAAMLVVQDRPIKDLFTSKDDTCVAVQPNGTFAPATCATRNTGAAAAGVLSDAGAMSSFFASMGFRRARWVQETFLCGKFPAERRADAAAKDPDGPEGYLSPYAFKGMPAGPIDFQARSVICANCHQTMNRLTPILGRYNASGAFTGSFTNDTFGVITPIARPRASVMADFLVDPNDKPAWRFGKPIGTMEDLGAAIAADPDMPRCIAARVWNWALSRGDVIVDQATLPPDISEELTRGFVADGYNVKKLIRRAMLSAAFIRY